MKDSFIVILVVLLTGYTAAPGQNVKNKAVVKADTIRVDSLEHRLIVLDPGFDSWLATQPSYQTPD